MKQRKKRNIHYRTLNFIAYTTTAYGQTNIYNVRWNNERAQPSTMRIVRLVGKEEEFKRNEFFVKSVTYI